MVSQTMRWFRLGIWVGLAASFYILVNEVLQDYAFYETWRWHIYKVLIGGGALLAIISKRSKAHAPSQERPADGGIRLSDDTTNGSERIFNQRYCGFILTTFGVIVRIVIPAEDVEMRVAARATEDEKAETEEVVPAAKAPTVFPDLHLQGVAVSKTNPSALINRKTYFVGDEIEGATVASIFPDSVVLQKDGESKVYILTRTATAKAANRP